jgi:hypothetical protein
MLLRLVGVQSPDPLRLYIGVNGIHKSLLLDIAMHQLDFLDLLPDFVVIWEVNQLKVLKLNELLVGEEAG